jgi:catalase
VAQEPVPGTHNTWIEPRDIVTDSLHRQLHEFGKLVLNKNPENFHRDVEQAAFSPGSMVPGIEDSPDPLLQFRMFFYRDAQYHRIGINLHQVPGM